MYCLTYDYINEVLDEIKILRERIDAGETIFDMTPTNLVDLDKINKQFYQEFTRDQDIFVIKETWNILRIIHHVKHIIVAKDDNLMTTMDDLEKSIKDLQTLMKQQI